MALRLMTLMMLSLTKRQVYVLRSLRRATPTHVPTARPAPPPFRNTAGENMSCDYNTPENVYTYWMASPTNRSNILDEQNYHYSKASVKVNIAEDGTYYWVMCVMATLEDVGPYVPPVSSAVSSPAA